MKHTTSSDWFISGLVTYYKKTKQGLWLTVKSRATRPNVYATDRMIFDCFVPKRMVTDRLYHSLHAKGRFEFKKDEVYFVVEEVL